MPKLKINIPREVLELPTEKRLTVAENLVKALGFKAALRQEQLEQHMWTPDPDPNIAALEDYYYENLAVPLWYCMLEVFDVLGLELPVTEEVPLVKSLFDMPEGPAESLAKSLLRDTYGKFRPQPERFAYYTNAEDPIYIPVNRLKTPYQTERAIDEAKVAAIKKEILKGRKLDPLVIGYDFDLHDGHHRWVAAQELGHTHVPCIVGGTDEQKVKRAEEFYRSMFKSITHMVNGITHLKLSLAISHNIRLEQEAVQEYTEHLNMAEDPQVRAVIEEIIQDEQDHIHNFTQLFWFLNGRNDALENLTKSVLPEDEAYPAEAANRYMWRGIGEKELQYILKNRKIKSKGKGNDDDQDGETLFADTYRVAENYARANFDLYNEPQAYVICVLRPEFAEENEAGELVCRKPVPLDHVVSIIPISPDPMEKAMDDDGKGLKDKLLSGVRKRYKERLKYRPDGKPYTAKQLAELERIMKKYGVNPDNWAESMAVRATLLGKLISEAERENRELMRLVLDTMPVDVEATKLPFKLKTQEKGEVPVLPLQSQELNAIKWAKTNAGENIRVNNQKMIAGVKQLVMQARRERWEPGKLAQALFDKFGQFNRDWRRIALTELAEATNNGYLMTLKDGDKVIGQSAADCCKYCEKWVKNRVYTFREQPGDPETEIWVGKSNAGLRSRDWRAAVIMHPHCRCRWQRFNDTFYKMEDGKLVLKTAQEIAQERGIIKDAEGF